MSSSVTKIVIVGHVDHGKSSLIGRLLFDTDSVPKDKIADVQKKCDRLGKPFEYAFLLDALEEEQEQTITIDTTSVYFSTDKKNYVIIDAPGHKEFLKNMVTGSSNADTAILMIDAEEGIKEQTRCHAYLLNLLGISEIIVVINKMDLVGYSQQKFSEIKSEILTLLSRLGLKPIDIIPISATAGDNVSSPSGNMPWYKDNCVLGSLDHFSVHYEEQKPLRFPVQDVYCWGKRILAGRIESGKMQVGDKVTFYPSSRKSIVKTIEKWDQSLAEARNGESIGITIEDPLFIERGEICAHENSAPFVAQEFKASIFWMGSLPLKSGKSYKLKLSTCEQSMEIASIVKSINASTLETQENVSEILRNEAGEVIIKTSKPLAVDLFSAVRSTGRFVIVDGYDIAGGGIITKI